MVVALGILAAALSIFSWIAWGIFVCLVILGLVLIPWGLWELCMFFTFNNIINLFAKLPGIIGFLFGFILALPFAAVSTAVSVWAYIQSLLMGYLTFRGFSDGVANVFIEKYVMPWEEGWPGSFFLVRFYYEHCQWLWGGMSFEYSFFPWENNVWCNITKIDFLQQIIKLFILGIPYTLMFALPVLPIIWSVMRPIIGGCSALPAVSGNGDGKD